MSVIKSFYFSCISHINLDWLIRHTSINVLVPYHHVVSNKTLDYITPLYAYKNVAGFEKELDTLLSHFTPLGLQELIQHQQNGRPLPPNRFLLTFDDGFREAFDVAVPILRQKGVPAAFFLNTAFLDNKELFYALKKGLILSAIQKEACSPTVFNTAAELFNRPITNAGELSKAVSSINYLDRHLADPIAALLGIDLEHFRNTEKPFMTSGQVHSLVNDGFGIGAHSIDHPLYKLLPLEEQIRQTIVSLDVLRSTFSLPYGAFAFPHTDEGVSEAFFQQLSADRLAPQIIFGNQTGLLEKRPGVLHRYIGENPGRTTRSMVKAVLSYNVFRKTIGTPYTKRTLH